MYTQHMHFINYIRRPGYADGLHEHDTTNKRKHYCEDNVC